MFYLRSHIQLSGQAEASLLLPRPGRSIFDIVYLSTAAPPCGRAEGPHGAPTCARLNLLRKVVPRISERDYPLPGGALSAGHGVDRSDSIEPLEGPPQRSRRPQRNRGLSRRAQRAFALPLGSL